MKIKKGESLAQLAMIFISFLGFGIARVYHSKQDKAFRLYIFRLYSLKMASMNTEEMAGDYLPVHYVLPGDQYGPALCRADSKRYNFYI